MKLPLKAILTLSSLLITTACNEETVSTPQNADQTPSAYEQKFDFPISEDEDLNIQPEPEYISRKTENFTPQELKLIQEIRQITKETGLPYNLDEGRQPVILEFEDTFEIYFSFTDPNWVGGSPEATVSKKTGKIINLQFTQ